MGEAHMRAVTSAAIAEDFMTSGVFPYSAYVFEESDFLASAVTDHPPETASLASGSSSKAEQDISVCEPAQSNIQLAGCVSELINENSTATYTSPERFRRFEELFLEKEKRGRSQAVAQF
jgi:hypothetical protein